VPSDESHAAAASWAVREVLSNHVATIIDGSDELAETVPLKARHDVIDDRLAGQIDQRLRTVLGEWAEPRAQPSRHEYDQHIVARGAVERIIDADGGNPTIRVQERELMNVPLTHEFDLLDRAAGYR